MTVAKEPYRKSCWTACWLRTGGWTHSRARNDTKQKGGKP